MATGTISNYPTIRTKTGTVITNSSGAALLGELVSKNNYILQVIITNSSNAMAIPFVYSNANWFVKVVYWDSMDPIANTSLNIVIKYI